jgi:predicted RNase H-like HicB family nuclease
MRFPINIRHDKDRDVWSGSCPSIRGVSAVGDSEDELKDNLTGELYSRLQELMDRRARIHIPKDVDDKDCYIELPFRAIAKLKVYEALLARNISRTTLAVRMAVKPEMVDKLFDLTDWTRTSVIENALSSMGFSIKMELVDLDTNPEFEFGGPEYAKS